MVVIASMESSVIWYAMYFHCWIVGHKINAAVVVGRLSQAQVDANFRGEKTRI
jgi:hypothetical protein